MNVAVVSHVYPANPLAPTNIPGILLPSFLHELVRLGANVHVLAPQGMEEQTPDPLAPVTRFAWWHTQRPLGTLRVTHPLDAARLLSFISRGIRFAASSRSISFSFA